MQKLEKLFSCVQTRQAAGKAIKEMKDQVMQQAARIGGAHKELANALIKSGLINGQRGSA